MDNVKRDATTINGGQHREKENLLGRDQEPVRLTPAWEERNLPNDKLNFHRGTGGALTEEPPRDRLNLVLFTLILHGIGTLTPWNMFITAKSYFVDYKLSKAYTGEDLEYIANFLAYLGIAAQLPNVLFNWVNVFVQFGGDLTKRIVWSLIIEVILFIITILLAMGDTSKMPGVFFWSTMATVVLLNVAGGIYQNSVYGMAAKLPIKYTGGVVLGSNISGTFCAIVSYVSGKFSSSVRTAAIYYFIAAIIVLLLCFDTYFALPLSRFYRHFDQQQQKAIEDAKTAQSNKKIPYWQIFKQAFPQLFNVFFIFFVTLTCFPTIHSDIKSATDDFPEFIKADFTTITCFLTFNFFAMIGSLLTSWCQFPSKKYLWIPVYARVLYIPLFIFCNYLPIGVERTLPVLITNDWVYWIIAITMSLSSGYLSSLAMMYAPSTVESRYSGTAGMMAAACLITGIFVGISFSRVMPWVVSNLSF